MWIFATMIPVFGLGMFMVLCRGALLPSDVIGEQESQRSHREDDAVLYNYDGDQGFYNDEIHPPTNNDTPVRDLSRGSRSVPQDKSNEMK